MGESRDDHARQPVDRRNDIDRGVLQSRPPHRGNRQSRARRRRGQALEAHARYRQRDSHGVRRHQVRVRSGEARRPSHGDGRESRAAQDEVRRFRRHGARCFRGRAGSIPSFPRQRRSSRDEGEVGMGVLPSPLAGSLLVAAAWLVVAVAGLIPAGNAAFARRFAFPLGAAAGVALAALGLQAVWLPAQTLTLPLGLPDLPFHVRMDPLAGFFLMLLGSVSAGISVYAAGYFREEPSGRLTLICLQYHVFLASMAFVLLADDAYLFMVAWETMALSSYFLVITDHQLPAVRRAGFLYLLIAHLGAIAILLCFGVLHGGRGDYTFDALRAAQLQPAWASVAFLLAFFGFGAKGGMIPLHAWLPEAHPAAPSPVSALMSGIMLKTAIYGMVRVIFDLIGNVRWEWGLVVLAIGAATTLFGVLYALMQHDLKRLLAYHS